MKVHILTLNWNGKHYLSELSKQLGWETGFCWEDGKIKEDWDYPVWHIRDNGSKDGSIDEINRWQLMSDCRISAKVYDIGHNRDSFAKGMNYLFDQANPADDDLVYLLNNDVSFTCQGKPVLETMWNLQKKTKAGVVGVRLLYNNTDKLQHAGVIFSHRYNDLPFHFRPGEKSDANAKKNRYFQVVTAALCLVNPISWRRVGGFDERYSWAFDDVDLNLKIGQTEKIAYCGETFAYHEESASLKKNPAHKLFMNQNVRILREKWAGKYKIDHDRYLKDPNYNIIK